MLICFICKTDIRSIKELLSHFKHAHGLAGRYGTFRCGQRQCLRSFNDKYTLARHIEREHEDDVENSNDRQIEMSVSKPLEESSSSGCAYMDCSAAEEAQEDVSVDFENEDMDLENLAAEFICKCKHMSTSLSVVNDIVFSCGVLVENIVSKLEARVIDTFSKVGLAADGIEVRQLIDEISMLKKPFKKMDTAHMQNKYWKDRGFLVEPKEYTVGVRQSYHTDKSTGMSVPRMELATGQFISVEEMLKCYLRNEDYAKMATENKEHEGDGDGVMKSYCDGKKWKREKEDKIINLRFYGDDIEPANPLGSHKTLYKIGCIYYQCESLPSWLLSKTENTLLALCYYAYDVKDFGWQKVLAPLLHDLKHL